MKNFRWFRSQSFESPLSINPDLVTNAADSIRSAHNSKQDSSSISFNAVVLGATGISLLGLAVVACSKQAHQPVTSLPTNVSPAVLQQPAASMPSAAAPATSVAEAKPMLKKAVHKRP